MAFSMLSEVGRLMRIAVKHPREAFVVDATIAAQWQELDFNAAPPRARHDEYDRFFDLLRSTGAVVDRLARDADTTLDSVDVRDAGIVSPQGVILCRMGRAPRRDPARRPGARLRRRSIACTSR